MSTATTKPAPRFLKVGRAESIKAVFQLADELTAAGRRHLATVPTGCQFNRLVEDLANKLPGVLYETVYASVLSLAGIELTFGVLQRTAWRLAGNLRRLQAGQPATPWLAQTELEWAPIQIVGAEPTIWKDRPGCTYEYVVIAGTAASMTVKSFWTKGYTKVVAHDLGFFQRLNRMYVPLMSQRELVGMYLYCLFDPELSLEKPRFYYHHVPSSFQKLNREVFRQRLRLVPCPLGHSLVTMSCHRCPLGQDRCPAACRKFTERITNESGVDERQDVACTDAAPTCAVPLSADAQEPYTGGRAIAVPC